ncbi:uncharacterized protein LOC125729865 isoform X3 [Brienomyrus brachyistius]|uniref:uncharacterized protein LOC125729865 isoform X1 n=1 Tax=Brienomyrus brachyistius TaxID=42636 RepID=UPI0020B44BF4|nr:uncharacterized protein LOC125729865 isoform X1 [Brienomyrus brachyistius]XP_048861663.1 uncharacterized protein LOC125729865 isoform X2 [Brienomyrus brachyistius]XP_048861664.1 uncharacterized protein LOC125729865 isoform X3 [Brienomyrus brachyistius]
MSAFIYLRRIDWLLPNDAVSVRIAPEDIPGSVSHGRTSTSSGGRRRKCHTGPPAPSSLTISGSAPIPVATSRAQQGRRRRRNTAGGRSGRRKKYKKQKGPFTKNLQKLLTFSDSKLANPFDSIQVGDQIPCEDLTQSDDEVASILCRTPSILEPELLTSLLFHFLLISITSPILFCLLSIPIFFYRLSSSVTMCSLTCKPSSTPIFSSSHGSSHPSVSGSSAGCSPLI